MAEELIEPPKSHGGRPKTAEPLVPVTAWVKPSEYDRLCRLAQKGDQKLSAVVRSLLVLRLP